VTGTATLQPVPVREVDDHQVGDGRRGPVTRELQSVYADVLSGRAERYRDWLDVVAVRQPTA
jgi:branched-chain amino acid aminotransferase